MTDLNSHTRLMDLVRYARQFLHEEGLISDEEFAALVADADSGKRVARLESYTQVRDRMKALQADLRAEKASHQNTAIELGQLQGQFRRRTDDIQALRNAIVLVEHKIDEHLQGHSYNQPPYPALGAALKACRDVLL